MLLKCVLCDFCAFSSTRFFFVLQEDVVVITQDGTRMVILNSTFVHKVFVLNFFWDKG